MAFNNSFTAVTGATYTAAQYNTHVRDNLTAIWVGTTAGDMDYYTSATAKNRLAIGGAGAILTSNGSAPTWLAIGAVGSILGASSSALRWDDGTRYIMNQLNADVALAVGDGQGWFFIPPGLNGYIVSYVGAIRQAGGTGVPEFQLRNVTDAVDLLGPKVTIDSGEVWSGSAATPPAINASFDDVVTGDIFAWDVDVAGTNSFNVVLMVGFKKL